MLFSRIIKKKTIKKEEEEKIIAYRQKDKQLQVQFCLK